MILRAKLCKECFKKGYDDTASDAFLLLDSTLKTCEFCKHEKYLVMKYFKWGEQEVSQNGMSLKTPVRKVKINPQFSYWGNQDPYIIIPVEEAE